MSYSIEGESAIEVPLAALEHYGYCHRQTALIHVEGIWGDSVDTVRGDLSHAAVDLPGARHRAGVLTVRSMPVWSDTHRLRGICDLVEIEGDEARPVEYKVGSYKPGGPAELQVGGQALCLIEAGFTVTEGYVYSVAQRRRYPIPITEALLAQVATAAEAIRTMLHTASLPTARNDSRCRKCSLRDDCLPEITHTRTGHVDLFTPRPMGDWRD